MLDTHRITLGKVSVAYDLTDREIDTLVESIGAEIGGAFYLSNMVYPQVKNLADVPKHVLRIMAGKNLERMRTIATLALRCAKGIDTKLDYAKLLEDSGQSVGKNPWSGYIKQDLSLHSIFTSFLRDMTTVDKRDCILYLHACGYAQKQEVQGLSGDFVRKIISSNQLVALKSTGSNKDNARIQLTRQACEAVRAEIGQGQHGFQVRGEYKVNQDHFRRTVQASLGNVKAHRDTVREEWGKVPKGIKHPGRVPEQ